jgi:hypothetical protein
MNAQTEIGELHRSCDELAELSTSFQIQLQAQTADSTSFLARFKTAARIKIIKTKKSGAR